MMSEITKTLTFATLDCGVCHVQFALEAEHLASLKRDGSAFWCPNGDRISYGDNENARLKREAEYARTALEAARDQADAAERSRRATKGAMTKLKNRVSNGVCPVPGCRRHFDDVQAHVDSKHPGWGATA